MRKLARLAIFFALGIFCFSESTNLTYAESGARNLYTWDLIGVSTWAGKPLLKIAKDSIVIKYTGVYEFRTRIEYSNPTEPNAANIKWVDQVWVANCHMKKLTLKNTLHYDKYANSIPNQARGSGPLAAEQFPLGEKLIDYVCPSTNVAESDSSSTSENQNDPAPSPPPPPVSTKESISFGTAWLSDSGYFVTAFHVVENAKTISLVLDKNQPISATLVSADKINDIAVLFSDLRNRTLKGLALTKSVPKLGARVFTLGFPHPDLMGVAPKFTAGEISSVYGIADDPRLLQISVPVQAGNSGGPLVNMNGEVVGIISSKLRAANVLKETGDLTENVNYAVKIDYLKPLINGLPLHRVRSTEIRPGKLEEMVSTVLPSVALVIAR